MKRFFLIAVLFFCVASLTAQVLLTHTIDAKDTLETIAQRYGVLPEDISASRLSRHFLPLQLELRPAKRHFR